MLSYRHAFHAGNHADVLKHAVLVLILEYLKQKDKPLWYIDTHAGAGCYDLGSAEARKVGEFKSGIGRLWLQQAGEQPAPALLGAYFDAVAALNPDGGLGSSLQGEPRSSLYGELRSYPGSPGFAAHCLREQDRLRLFELHPRDGELLQQLFAADRRVQVNAADGFAGLKALLPPPSRRAVVLIDPPYELKEDYRRVETVLAEAHQRFATGTYVIWYPLLPRPEAQALPERLARLELPALRVELAVDKPGEEFGLYGSGLFIVNPPWTLAGQLEELLPWLRDRLALCDAAGFRLDVLGRH